MKIRIRSFVLMVLFVSFGGYAAASAKESTAALNAKYAASTANAPAPEAVPVKNAPATPEPAMTVNGAGYKIIPGDVLQIDVWKEDGLNQEVLVLPDGMITFPLAGSFSVLNMNPEEVQATLKDKLKQYIPDATVTVSVKAALGHTVSVIGQVTKPGEFIMSHGLTVMQALSQAGGLTPYADEGSVIVLRRTGDGKETSIPVPYDDISRGRELDQDLVLNPGDVVVVPTTSLF